MTGRTWRLQVRDRPPLFTLSLHHFKCRCLSRNFVDRGAHDEFFALPNNPWCNERVHLPCFSSSGQTLRRSIGRRSHGWLAHDVPREEEKQMSEGRSLHEHFPGSSPKCPRHRVRANHWESRFRTPRDMTSARFEGTGEKKRARSKEKPSLAVCSHFFQTTALKMPRAAWQFRFGPSMTPVMSRLAETAKRR